jgi:hypothetical protein
MKRRRNRWTEKYGEYPTIEVCAIEILKKSGKPLSTKEITDEIVKIRPIDSKTPTRSVYSILYYSKKIVRVGKGLFTLAKTE